MYPLGNLPGNLVAFGDFLRSEYQFALGPGELRDCARALEVIDISDETSVRLAFRTILSTSVEEAQVFDDAFTRFFFPGPAGIPQTEQQNVRHILDSGKEDGGVRIKYKPAVPPQETTTDETSEATGGINAPIATEESDSSAQLFVRGSYSPLKEESSSAPPELRPAESIWRKSASTFVRRLHFGLSRRWQPALRGSRFDLRRTLRNSLQTGTEILTARYLRRPRRTPRFVLLIDGSRSMAVYVPNALKISVAIASVTMHLEAYIFSTGLRRITRDVRHAASGEKRRLEHLQYAWAGGTSIGQCLRELLQHFGERIIKHDTVVMIISDGLDVGEVSVLRDAMRELHRRSAGIIWLNPLIATPGYEPTATGMRVARPYIDIFTGANDHTSFTRLARSMRLRGRS